MSNSPPFTRRFPQTRISSQSKWWTGRVSLRTCRLFSHFRDCHRIMILSIQIMLIIHHLDIFRDWFRDWGVCYSWQTVLLVLPLVRKIMLIKLSPLTDHSLLSCWVIEPPTLVTLLLSNEDTLLHV